MTKNDVTIEQWADMCFRLLHNSDDKQVVAEFGIEENPDYAGKSMRVTIELVDNEGD